MESLQVDATPSFDECLEYFGTYFPKLHCLKDTPQDAQWHAEGDVATHTNMVLQELYLLLADEYAHLQGSRRQALIIATALHDIAKAWTTCERDVRGEMHIVAPRHEAKGRSYLCFLLRQLPLEYSVVHSVLMLIGEHNRPKHLAISGDENGYLQLSRMVDIELLYLLELADMRGRIAKDVGDTVELIQLFKLYAEEFGCWKECPYLSWNDELKSKSGYEGDLLDLTIAQSKSDREAGLIWSPDEAIARSFKYREGFPSVVILCGLSGSGKSSYVEKHYGDHRIISLDLIREQLFGKQSKQGNPGMVMQEAKEQLRQVLREKGKAVWDATSLRKDFRSMVIDLVRDYGGMTTLVFFHTSIAEAKSGNKSRERQVDAQVLQKQIDTFEYPTMDEVHRMKIVDNRGSELWSYGFNGE